MCGIFGAINHKVNGFTKPDEDILKRLCYIDKERGEDSTGIFTGTNSGVVYLAKEASTPEKFLDTDEAKEVFQKAYGSGAFLVGHNRKATKGSVNDTNAHPFHVGDIVLVHNGSLWTHKKLADTEVDSEAIAHALNDYKGDDIAEVFNNVNGAYSCVWYDNRDKTLNFFRNDQRPMFIFESATTSFFGSEVLMLYYSVRKSGVEWKNESCLEVPVHHHLKYKMTGRGGMEKDGDPVKKDIKSFTAGSTTTPNKAVTTTDATTGVIKGNVSLAQRKRMRNEMCNWLAKNPLQKKVVTFVADDYFEMGGKWTLFGSVLGAPSFITAIAETDLMVTEDELVALLDECSMQIPVVVMGYETNHKKLSFQLNTRVANEAVFTDPKAVRSNG